MDLGDFVGMSDAQNIAKSNEVFSVRTKAIATHILFRKLVALNHGAHGAIEDQNAITQQSFEQVGLIGERGERHKR